MIWKSILLLLSVHYFFITAVDGQCMNGTVRVSSSSHYGAVEVCVNGTWGSICSDFWDNNDASVVCRQLGYSPYGAIGSSIVYTASTTLAHNIIDLNCTGTEVTILDCPNNGFTDYNCSLNNDANVFCESISLVTQSNCTDGDVILVGGTSKYEGRVEVCVNKAWGTVCDSGWSSLDAKVVCRQIGAIYLGGYTYGRVGNLGFSQGNGPILLGYLYCSGQESNLLQCHQNYQYTSSYCQDHFYDVAVKCETPCVNDAIRLSDGGTFYGRVELCSNGTWGTICSHFWDNNDASVICRQLGYSPYGAVAVSDSYIEYNWPHYISDLNCNGTESTYLNCSYNELINYNCPNNADASIVCQNVGTMVSNCSDGDVRLFGGRTQYEGRVEVCINKVWGTVCSQTNRYSWYSRYYFSTNDANVVCRQVGHMEFGSVVYNNANQFGQGTGPIFASNFFCSGQESRLLDCPHSQIPSSSCTHYYDVGIKCEAPCANGTVRLYSESGSYFRRYGRVEVCVNNTWGTICDDYWDNNDASVVCRHLGYSPYGAFALTNSYTEGDWLIHINDLNCAGDESSLWDCPMNRISGHTCNHYSDSAVVCQLLSVDNSDNCTDNDIRLTGGVTQYEGRVEICTNGVWGTFCDYGWGINQAYAVCSQLGYQAVTALQNSYFGISYTPLHVYYTSCSSYAVNLQRCSMYRSPNYYYYSQCNIYNQAGVRCETFCSHGTTELYSGSSSRQGNIRVCINGTWYKICAYGDTVTDDNLASVACSSAGFSFYGARSSSGNWNDRIYHYGIFNVQCFGNESNLFDCLYDTTGWCPSYYTAVAVFCQQNTIEGPANCTNGDIRLYGNSTINKGTLQVCSNEIWSVVCPNSWNNQDTTVVCHELGFTRYDNSYSISLTNKQYPSFYQFYCNGYEGSLSSCSNSTNYQECPHLSVYVTCSDYLQVCLNGDIRLVGGLYYGRVEVCVGGVWGTVCRDTYWDNNDASVVCRQLGFSPYGAIAIQYNWYTEYYHPTLISGLNCTGTEDHLFNCSYMYTQACPSYADANVICPIHGSTYSNCTDGEVRLFGGSANNEGTVEVCLNHAWGTISYYYWNYNLAQTICNSLGYRSPGASLVYNAHFGEGSGPILASYVYCYRPMNSILDCYIRFHYSISRNHNNDIGVICQTACNSGDIRLVGSTDPLVGRVEVCVNGTWGTICNDYWNNSDASVVCRQLGYSGPGAIASTAYHDYSKSFHIIDLNCNGDESSIFNCSYSNVQQCYNYRDAYVHCPTPNRTDNCTNGDIRLVNGQSQYEGLVEICSNGSWGYICPRYWDNTDAKVACRQLGFTDIGAKSSSSFGKGAGPLHFSSFACSGSENNLFNCTHYPYTCYYSYYAGIICQAPCTNGDIRLMGDSRYDSFGRVEVCVNDTWGTICDDYWDNNDASVVCRHLGYSPYGAISRASYYSESVLSHVFFNVTCLGNEAVLQDCGYNSEKSSGCYSYEDAGVICQNIDTVYSNCMDYDVRLVDGTSANEGKVLMCINGVWGTVCDNSLSSTDVYFICLQAGYQIGGSTYSQYFSNSSNDILLIQDISCSLSDDSIKQCGISYFTKTSTCDHIKDTAAVKCLSCTDNDTRIVPYNSSPHGSSIGRVEVCINGTWGTICSDFFDDEDAMVICRQLGYTPLGSMSTGNIQNENPYPFHFIDLNCTGSEDSIWECPSNSLTQYNCPNYHDASVSCHKFDVEYSNCSNGQMRLSGSSLRGRVEICYNNTWFGVCSDLYYTYNNPQVVCSALGYSDASGYVDAFSDLDGIPLIPYRFNCNGNEKSLLDCAKSTSACSGYNSYYGHIYYAGVTCQLACNHSDIRLAGSPYETFGRVEVCINGTWGTVCSNDFDSDDAEVVCSHLGYSQYGAIILTYNTYYARYLDVHIYSLSCTGNETNIWDCPYVLQNNQYCYYRYDAAVHCQYFNDTVDTSCVTGDVRLVGGTNELEGTVELCYNKFWGPVCHRSWDVTDANVVCKQLGYQSKGSTRFTNAYFGEGTGPYIISDLSCYSSSTTLLSCYSNFINTVLCGDSASAGVSCVDPCDEGSVRLSGSTIQFAGRVEICIENTWTTLCDQSWDLSDAQVACRELGYSPYGAIPTYGCYTEGQLSFGITSLNCVGNEDSLINCSHSSPSLYNCWSYNDAGLVCQTFVNETNCSNGEIRLVDGKVPNEGRVEICLNKVWGTICSSGWSVADSNVICRQLGYLPRGSTPMNNAHYGQGTGPVLMSRLYCGGSEDSLLECNHRSCGVTSCTHHDDAGVFCEVPCTNGSMRLGSNAVLKGRVEFCVNNSWVTICTHHWTTSEASVICSQLGYSRYGATATSDYYYNYYYNYNNYGWPMGVYQLHCIGNEGTIDECQYNTSYSGPGCYDWYYNNVAAVRCMPNTTEYVNCVDGDVRLVGGATHNEGNVQMCYSNAWGSVCNDYWDTRDTNVVCRQLGFKPYDSIPYRYNYFGVANSPPFVHGLFNCLGSELSLITCSIYMHSYYYYSFLYRCYDYEIAGVKCEVNPEIHLEKAQINTEYNISTLSLTCSAVGATSYHWTDLSTGNVVSNSSMHHVNIESSMNSPGYQCTALNKNSSTTATIRGANLDSC